MNDDQIYDAAEREMDLYRAEIDRITARLAVAETERDDLRAELAKSAEAVTAYTEALNAGRLERDQARGQQDETAAELVRVKGLLGDFTHAVIDGRASPLVKAAARAAREEAGLPVAGGPGEKGVTGK